MSTILEIAANSFESCLAAQESGADRIELFENLPEGGCTPSYGMLSLVKERIQIPTFVMIRPRGGDFVYSDEEFDIMRRDLKLCREMGFPGVVFGILDAAGNVELPRCQELLSLCGEMEVTFHRAFDRCRDLHTSIRQLIELGFTRVLSSGGAANVDAGKDTIHNLQKEYGQDIVIMPGCGVTAANARGIVDYCGVREIHATAKAIFPNQSSFLKETFKDERPASNPEEIARIREALL
jgi:copper homeostasis protein